MTTSTEEQAKPNGTAECTAVDSSAAVDGAPVHCACNCGGVSAAIAKALTEVVKAVENRKDESTTESTDESSEEADKDKDKDGEEKKDEDAMDVKNKTEIKHLEERINKEGHSVIQEPTGPPPDKVDTEKWREYALCVIRHFDYKERYQYSSVQIKSPFIKEILKEKIGDTYPGVSFMTEDVSINLPSECFYHYRLELKKLADEMEAGEKKEHLEFFNKFIAEQYADTIKETDNLLPQKLISYPLLWCIFRPATFCTNKFFDRPRAYEIKDTNYICGEQPFFQVKTEYIDYDGKSFGKRTACLAIPPFAGTVKISSLRVIPLLYHPKEESLREQLIERGRQFEGYAGHHYLEYSGIALGPVEDQKRIKYNINGRVMVDTETFNRRNYARSIDVEALPGQPGAVEDGFDTEEMDEALREALAEQGPLKLTDDQCLMATNTVCGFAFNGKEWAEFFIDVLKPVEWNDRAFDSLVLPEKQKSLVKALVESHMKESDFDDFIKGKGKGLIAVLHGPPGVGKTLTAESVAEYTHRPLYMVSSGELGVDAYDLENRLKEVLDIASTWKAVLLLDEADVFLEKRSLHDLNRNALVSIFLRLLEYYEGVMCMTTNRVTTFDEAFQSRIHVALKYSDLERPARREVWQNFLSKTNATFDDKALNRLSEKVLNGRQIKNMVRTAKSLAEHQGKLVTVEDLLTVVEIQREFENELNPPKHLYS